MIKKRLLELEVDLLYIDELSTILYNIYYEYKNNLYKGKSVIVFVKEISAPAIRHLIKKFKL